MDSKHRVTTINGVIYAWSISQGIDEYTNKRFSNFNYIRIWEKETKKFILEQKFPSHQIIEPKIIFKLIKAKDYIARNLIVAEPCPFCQGKLKEHPNTEWRENFYICYHEEDCYLGDDDFSLINVKHINNWNYRNLK